MGKTKLRIVEITIYDPKKSNVNPGANRPLHLSLITLFAQNYSGTTGNLYTRFTRRVEVFLSGGILVVGGFSNKFVSPRVAPLKRSRINRYRSL